MLPAIHALLVATLGPERVTRIQRPEIWVWPREACALLCLLGSIALAALAWRESRGSSSPRDERPPIA